MSEKKELGRSRNEYLLTVRTKELAAAREHIAALEEMLKLEGALLASALLLAAGEERLRHKGEALVILKQAVRDALKHYSVSAEDAGDAYRISLVRCEEQEEERHDGA